jgi:hypothetical protein
MRADLVYSDDEGHVYAEATPYSGHPLFAVPDGDGGIRWSREKAPLGMEGEPVLALIAKAFNWGP